MRHPVHHPSYIEFFNRLLPETRDAYELERKYQDEFAYNPSYVEMYRRGNAYHGAHPFYMWYWGQRGREKLSRVIVVGVCMQADKIEPAMAINKEIELRFVLGYTPLEYRDALHLLAEGKVQADALVTGTVGLDGVEAAFTALGDPEKHAKIMIDPWSDARL